MNAITANPFTELSNKIDQLETLILSLNRKETTKKNLTLKEAAQYVCLPIPTFREHLVKGNITGSKPGKSWIFSTDDLNKFLDDFKRTPERIRARAEARLLKR